MRQVWLVSEERHGYRPDDLRRWNGDDARSVLVEVCDVCMSPSQVYLEQVNGVWTKGGMGAPSFTSQRRASQRRDRDAQSAGTQPGQPL